jgi:hypothetical protein
MLSGTSDKSMMFKSKWLLCVGLGALAIASTTLAADKKPDMSKVPPASDKKGLTFDTDIKPLLEKSCLKCHSGDKPKGKYKVDSLAAFLKGGESGEAAVVPGQSAKSPVVLFASDAVEEMEMPPVDKRDKFPGLTKQQVGVLRAWIDQGAK